jgi:hypothetical protein
MDASYSMNVRTYPFKNTLSLVAKHSLFVKFCLSYQSARIVSVKLTVVSSSLPSHLYKLIYISSKAVP